MNSKSQAQSMAFSKTKIAWIAMISFQLVTICSPQTTIRNSTYLPTTSLINTSTQNPTSNQLISCTNCANNQLNCTDSVKDCIIICKYPYACNNTIINCQHGMNCNISCKTIHSCHAITINCANNASCHIHGNGKLSLRDSKINGPSFNGKLNINCNKDEACLHSHINGTKANDVQIHCIGANSCGDITLHCPSFKQNIKDTMTKHCVVIGSSELTDISDINSGITIYAENSWLDIKFVQYLPYIPNKNSVMHCNNDQCVIANPYIENEWNCNDIMSRCYVEKKNITLIHCNSTNTCENTVVNCNEHMNDGCKIICQDDNSCAKANILCSAADCVIICIGDASCSQANVFGAFDTQMNVLCTGINSCIETNFYGNISNELTIKCMNMNGSCQDMNVYCPTNINKIKQCIIIGEDVDIHSDLDFYCLNGFYDVDLNNYSAQLVTEHGYSNMMHCGTNHNLSCVMNTSLLCNCIEQDIITKLGHHEKIGLIVGCSVMGIIIIIVVIYYVVSPSEKDAKIKPEYSPIQQEQLEPVGDTIELNQTVTNKVDTTATNPANMIGK